MAFLSPTKNIIKTRLLALRFTVVIKVPQKKFSDAMDFLFSSATDISYLQRKGAVRSATAINSCT